MGFKRIEKICVLGLGYIGLPTAAVIASRKIQVIGVDVNKAVVDTINRGEIHIVEPELDIVVHSVVNEGYLKASLTPESADVFVVAVPTPFKNDHQPDLSYIQAAAESISPFIKCGNLVILESTSPVGATEQMTKWLSQLRADLTFPLMHGENSDIRVAHCPERVLPGHVVRELVENDRIIGGVTKKCANAALELYKIFVEGECLLTDARTAEMAKLTENSFRDVNIAFANELSIICDKQGIDVWELIDLANRHPRVNILQPGPGVGGHCIAVDPWFIVSSAPEQSKLIRTAREVNDDKPEWVIQKVKKLVGELLQAQPHKTAKDITVACFGLAFKADIDDLRESPAVRITLKLAFLFPGAVFAVEPNIDSLPLEFREIIELINIDEALELADILVLLVDHKQFRELPKNLIKDIKILDTRGIWI